MGLSDRIRFQYNARVRPRLNGDLKRLFQLNEEKYPFEALKPGEHIRLALDWLAATHAEVDQKGFPTKFNVKYSYGLGPSYPETTGYTLNTLLTMLRNWDQFVEISGEKAHSPSKSRIATLTRNSFDWLKSIQFENGAWTGGHAALHNYGTPSVFNTGQILLGMVDVYRSTGGEVAEVAEFQSVDREDLKQRCHKAAHWLKDQLAEDGSFKTEFAYTETPLTYYSRSMYGALNTAVFLEDEDLLKGIRPHYDWVTSMQEPSGWINNWGFEQDWAVMHRISYTLRGMVEAAIRYEDEKYLEVVLKGIDFLLQTDLKGFTYAGNEVPEAIPSYVSRQGKFRNELCPTGLSQLAIVLAKLPDSHRSEKHERLFQNIVDLTKRLQTRGFRNPLMNGVLPGSYPLQGKYKSFDLLEWATKFFLDTLLIEAGIPAKEIRG